MDGEEGVKGLERSGGVNDWRGDELAGDEDSEGTESSQCAGRNVKASESAVMTARETRLPHAVA